MSFDYCIYYTHESYLSSIAEVQGVRLAETPEAVPEAVMRELGLSFVAYAIVVPHLDRERGIWFVSCWIDGTVFGYAARQEFGGKEQTTSGLNGYWVVPVSKQQDLRAGVERLDLEAYAREHGLIVYEGGTIKPEDYPCECELQDPDQCCLYKGVVAEMKSGGEICVCECHRYFEPF